MSQFLGTPERYLGPSPVAGIIAVVATVAAFAAVIWWGAARANQAGEHPDWVAEGRDVSSIALVIGAAGFYCPQVKHARDSDMSPYGPKVDVQCADGSGATSPALRFAIYPQTEKVEPWPGS